MWRWKGKHNSGSCKIAVFFSTDSYLQGHIPLGLGKSSWGKTKVAEGVFVFHPVLRVTAAAALWKGPAATEDNHGHLPDRGQGVGGRHQFRLCHTAAPFQCLGLTRELTRTRQLQLSTAAVWRATDLGQGGRGCAGTKGKAASNPITLVFPRWRHR